MDHNDPTTHTGMLGSEIENRGPGHDTRQTNPAAIADADDPETTAAMSDTATQSAPGSAATSLALLGTSRCPIH